MITSCPVSILHCQKKKQRRKINLRQSCAQAFGDTVRHITEKEKKPQKMLPVKVPQPDTNSWTEKRVSISILIEKEKNTQLYRRNAKRWGAKIVKWG